MEIRKTVFDGDTITVSVGTTIIGTMRLGKCEAGKASIQYDFDEKLTVSIACGAYGIKRRLTQRPPKE